jgi:nucleotide-binding universal stress UspA family protein
LDNEASAGPEYVRVVSGGSPAAVRADVAELENADQIVVGTRGKGRLGSLLGSVSAELLRIADRPVVLIRHGSWIDFRAAR